MRAKKGEEGGWKANTENLKEETVRVRESLCVREIDIARVRERERVRARMEKERTNREMSGVKKAVKFVQQGMRQVTNKNKGKLKDLRMICGLLQSSNAIDTWSIPEIGYYKFIALKRDRVFHVGKMRQMHFMYRILVFLYVTSLETKCFVSDLSVLYTYPPCSFDRACEDRYEKRVKTRELVLSIFATKLDSIPRNSSSNFDL